MPKQAFAIPAGGPDDRQAAKSGAGQEVVEALNGCRTRGARQGGSGQEPSGQAEQQSGRRRGGRAGNGGDQQVAAAGADLALENVADGGGRAQGSLTT